MARVKFRFKPGLSADQKMKIKQMGFDYFSSNGEWIMYVKREGCTSTIHNHTPPDFRGLSESRQAELANRCNAILDRYPDPEKYKNVIRMRCTNIARLLEPREREWVMDWIKRIVDDEDSL